MSDLMRIALAKRLAVLESEPEPLLVEPMSRETLEAVHRRLLAGETHYTDRPGIEELRERITAALDLGRSKAEVIVTSGEQEALFVTLMGLALDPGDFAVVGDACAHRSLFQLLGWSPKSVAEGESVRLRYSETDDVTPNDDVPLVVNLRDALASRSPSPTRLPENAIIIGNLDGLEGLAGCRVGFVSAPADLVKSIRSWKQTLSICTAAPSQRAAFIVWSQRGDAS